MTTTSTSTLARLSPPAVVGRVRRIMDFRRDPFASFERYSQTRLHRLDFGAFEMVVLNHPDDIAYVLVTNAKNYHKDHLSFPEAFTLLLGNGLLTSEDDFWLRQRRMMAPAFHRKRIEGYAETIRCIAEESIAPWRDGAVVAVDQAMMRLTLDVATATLFGGQKADGASVAEAAGVIMDYFATEGWDVFFPLSLPLPRNRRYRRALQQLDDVVHRLIAAKQCEIAAGGQPTDLLAMLIEARDEEGEAMTPKQLRDEVMTMLLASHETTALALSYTLYLLARHPEAQAKLSEEIGAVVGTGAPTLAQVRQLPYLDQVIKESMRLYPPAYAFGREPIADDVINGQPIPAGTQLLMLPYTMHRNPEYYEHPHSFLPDRWTEAFERSLPRFAYFPFGGGPRQCIGRDFAMLELQIVLITILQRFTVALVDDAPPERQAAITMRPKGGIRLRVNLHSVGE